MDRYLTALRLKRDDVQAAIDAEYARPHPDGIVLTGLKKLKLRLRDRIEQAERARFFRLAPPTVQDHAARPLRCR